jgi:transcriptional regulator with XRE-family HTH domain
MGETTTARARELGDELRQYREELGIPSNVLAERLGWSPSKISRFEKGKAPVSGIDIVRYAAHCGLSYGSIDALLAMIQEPAAPGYWLSNRLSALVFYESTASFSVSYDPLVVPGLLQTEEYATALISGEGLTPTVIEYRVAARMERQRVLQRRRFVFYIHEQALRLPVGDDQVMNEQVLKLALLAGQPQITIRVVPSALGARSVFEGEFVLLRYSDHDPLVYLGGVGLFLEHRDQMTRYEEKLTRLSEVALGRGESREMLAALASEFDRPEDSLDAPDHLAKEQLQLSV